MHAYEANSLTEALPEERHNSPSQEYICPYDATVVESLGTCLLPPSTADLSSVFVSGPCDMVETQYLELLRSGTSSRFPASFARFGIVQGVHSDTTVRTALTNMGTMRASDVAAFFGAWMKRHRDTLCPLGYSVVCFCSDFTVRMFRRKESDRPMLLAHKYPLRIVAGDLVVLAGRAV